MSAHPSSRTTRYPERGFTLIEAVAAMLVSSIVLAGLMGFYLSEQRAFAHHRTEVETSQGLRTAIEQISRDLRSARQDITGSAAPTFVSADTNTVEFELDANNDGSVTSTDANEHKGFRLNSGASTIESYQAGSASWSTLADNVSDLTFAYWDCSHAALTAPVGSPDNIASIDISVTVTRSIIGGLPLSRTEKDTVRLRNKSC